MVYSIGIRYYRLFFIIVAIYLMILVLRHTDNALNNRADEITNELEKIEVSREDKLRTILLWTRFYNDDTFMFGFDEEPFVGENRCPVSNCLVTNNRSMLDITDYDVIVFHLWGRSIPADFEPPKRRSPNQYYAFASLEVSDNFQVYNTVTKDFFNWTITYRQDSDFHWPYYRITDLYNTSRILAPATSPEWIGHRDKIVDVRKAVPTLDKKHKKAAWFVSRCTSKSRREKYVAELQKHIEIDVYGRCGPLQCKRNNQDDLCHEMLQTDYYFYLAFENADCFDYVSEKAIHPLQHDVIPIVFGAADYTQHLPPHSYINAKEYKPKELAELMDRIIANQTEYAQYFWWKDHYKIHNIGIATVPALPYLHPFCEICKALQNPNLPGKLYDDINAWWVGNKTHPACIH